MNIELCATYQDRTAAREMVTKLGGRFYCEQRDDTGHLPFAAMICTQTDDLAELMTSADVGLYMVCRRVIKPRANPDQLPGAIGLFPMVAHPDLGHAQSDAHWRDRHAPLALKVHVAMSHYTQLSIMHCFKGPVLDGIALCGFESLIDLRENFFDTPEGEKAIHKDIAQFADTRKSPRRLIVTESHFS